VLDGVDACLAGGAFRALLHAPPAAVPDESTAACPSPRRALLMSQAAPVEPVALWTTKAEREKYESFADLYALIKTVEKLEKAYVRDAVGSAEYEAACLDLIAKFKTLRTALRDDGVPDVEHFMATYRMDCASAAQRLLRSGLPATIEHRPARRGARRAGAPARAAR
jgi:hypothetical protein